MSVGSAGCTHGRFDHVKKSALAGRPDAVIFLGDIEPAHPFEAEIAPLVAAGIDVRWIRGNHDTDSRTAWDKLSGAMDRNLDGRVVEVAGVRIAGLGGIFRDEIWYPDPANALGAAPHFASYETYCAALAGRPQARSRAPVSPDDDPAAAAIRENKRLKHHSTIFWDTYEQLWEQTADILVTHEAPSCHPHGFAAIDELAQAMQVKAVFHGHHHDCLDYRAWDDKLGFRAYGVGFRGITDETGQIVLAGDFDAAQSFRLQHPEEM